MRNFTKKLNAALYLSAMLIPALANFQAHADDQTVTTDPRVSLSCAQPKVDASATPAQLLKTEKAPVTVAGLVYDSVHENYQPVRLRAEFTIRAKPSANASQKLGMVRNEATNGKLVLSGVTQIDDKQKEWVQVLMHGKIAWISKEALIDGLPKGTEHKGAIATVEIIKPQPVKKQAAISIPIPTTVPMIPAKEVEPGDEEIAEQPVAAPKPVKAKPVVKVDDHKPICVATEKEMQRSDRFKRAFRGSDPFTRWMGPMSASIDVSSVGTAILHHPFKGDMSFAVNLCLDGNDKPYLSLNGQYIYFEGPDLTRVTVRDTDGTPYNFEKVVN